MDVNRAMPVLVLAPLMEESLKSNKPGPGRVI